MHRVIEILSCRGWRLDQVFHTQGLLPAGPSACNMLVFSRAMSGGGAGRKSNRMSGVIEFGDEDTSSVLARGYTSAQSIRRNTDVTIGPDGGIVRDGGAKTVPQTVQEE